MNIKCNICGGDVSVSADKTFATCEYCGSTVTVPRVSDEQRAAAFNRGSHFRRIGEFDKALASYERILREDDTDAEAHWCAALCRFGIEYVEDPATFEWLPTCHRASFDSFLEDVDFKAALEHSDGLTRRLYQKEAAKIAEVQRGILATSQNEEPYDVFLCYKETGEDGQRTRDSILAQDIYYQLTDQGHRVFFSRITLEDKAGSQYEPYIFAALNSAKVMVAVGTKPEHFSAVWVKNEWSRFLALMRRDRSRVLLPCYRDMDPYDLPEQLAVLQSYDMGKIGFIQDLIRGVDKVVKAGKTEAAPVVVQAAEPVVIQQSAATNTNALVKRGYMALEDSEWAKADDFFEQALNQNAELAEAYLGKFLSKNRAMSLDDLSVQLVARTEKASVVRKEACPRDIDAESRAVKEYFVPIFLEETAIRCMFFYDRTYESTAESRQKQLNEIKQLFEQDKTLNRAEQFGDAKLKTQIAEFQNSILPILSARLVEALSKDSAAATEIQRNYEQHLQNTLSVVQQKNREGKTAYLQTNYKNAQQALKNSQNPADYIRASEMFAKLGNYADAADMAAVCKDCANSMNKHWYEMATKMMRNATNTEQSNQAAALFHKLGNYLDSPELEKKCYENNMEAIRRARRAAILCQHCGGEFQGFFTPKCSRCGKTKDYWED